MGTITSYCCGKNRNSDNSSARSSAEDNQSNEADAPILKAATPKASLQEISPLVPTLPIGPSPVQNCSHASSTKVEEAVLESDPASSPSPSPSPSASNFLSLSPSSAPADRSKLKNIYEGVEPDKLEKKLESGRKKQKQAEQRLRKANIEPVPEQKDTSFLDFSPAQAAEAEVLVYLIGDGGVGKTCLAKSFYGQGEFSEDYKPTCYGEHDVYLNATVNGRTVRTKITIVDTAGQEEVYAVFKQLATARVATFARKAPKASGLVIVMCHQWNKAETFSNLVYDDGEDEDDNIKGSIVNAADLLRVYNDKTTGSEDKPGNASIILCATQTDNGDQATSDGKVDEQVKNLHKNSALEGLMKSGRVAKCNCSAYFDYPSVVEVFSTASEMALTEYFS